MYRACCRFLSALALAAILPVSARAANQVHVVTQVGSNALQVAIDAASDGDVLLVREGSYAGKIDDKSLTIVADDTPAAGGHFIARLWVSNLAAGKRVTVRGFQMVTAATFQPPFEG